MHQLDLEFFSTCSPLQSSLLKAAINLPVVDSHTHFLQEGKYKFADTPDAFMLLSQYVKHDLISAGMSDIELQQLFSSNFTPEEKFELFKKYEWRISQTAYYRSFCITLRRFFGEDRLTADNVRRVSNKVSSFMSQTRYEDFFRKNLNYSFCMNEYIYEPNFYSAFYPRILRIPNYIGSYDTFRASYEQKHSINSLKELDDEICRRVESGLCRGIVGLKTFAVPEGDASRDEAERTLRLLLGNHELSIPEYDNPLSRYISRRTVELAHEGGLVTAVHTGYWDDFRQLHPAHMLPLIDAYPDVRFDLYHLGYPYVRESILLAKTRPNVCINLCWTYLISQRVAREAIAEILETVPLNKVIAFGSDTVVAPEAFGHLVMCLESLSCALADRVSASFLTEDSAAEIAGRWLSGNAIDWYGLEPA